MSRHHAWLSVGLVFVSIWGVSRAEAFCGFYVAKADTQLFNKASKVVLVRNGDRTVLTMANDFKGDPKEFAIVVPVPTFLEKDQIHVGDRAVVDHLDAYSAPRLVEYFDEDPCNQRLYEMAKGMPQAATMDSGGARRNGAKALGVTIEAEYTVGEYDIQILSAKESTGLLTYLKSSGYKLPNGADAILSSYIKQKLRFFVAKVNLKEQSKTGYTYLRPIQIAFESPKFMLPIRLGTLNSDGHQDLFVLALTKKGRIETTNYRTIKLPSNENVPVYVKDEFPAFYRSVFDTAVKKENMKAVFLEYAWNMNWCDPCAADPLTQDELKGLGVFWLDGDVESAAAPAAKGANNQILPMPGPRRPMPPGGGAAEVFVTRLHVRYNAENFPEDLVFQETGDTENFQGRYVLNHEWKGSPNQCDAAKKYLEGLPARRDTEAMTLARLTGWDINDIRTKMKLAGGVTPSQPKDAQDPEPKKLKWYQKLWK